MSNPLITAAITTAFFAASTAHAAPPPLKIKELSSGHVEIDTVAYRNNITVDCSKGSVQVQRKPLPGRKLVDQEPNLIVTTVLFDKATGKVKAYASAPMEVNISDKLTLGKVCDGEAPRPAQDIVNGLKHTLTYRF